MSTLLETVAELLLDAEKSAKGHRARLFQLMQEGSVERVDVPGKGFVVLVEASTSSPIDAKACAAKLAKLGARLRELGANDVDDAVPLTVAHRGAGVRVTQKAA